MRSFPRQSSRPPSDVAALQWALSLAKTARTQVYYERKKGFVSSIIKPVASGKDSVSVAEVASELALTSRPENASDDEEGDGAIGGEDSDAED